MRPLVHRPLEPADVAAVGDLVGGCSGQSLRNRFFGHVASPVELLAGQLQEAIAAGGAVGSFDGHALVALGTGLPTAVGRSDGRSHEWELGLLVCDRWQDRGVGSHVADQVVAAALAAGLHVVAHVETANVPAVRLVHALQRRYAERVRIERQ